MRRYKALPVNMPEEVVDPIPLTADFLAEAKAKRVALKKERVEVMERLKEARAKGDLSENGAYKYAKFELGNIGRQLRDLNFIIKHGYIEQKAPAGEVGFGAVVTLTELKRGKEITYTLLSDYQADPSKGSISLKSPLGQQLIGKKTGDMVILKLPRQTTEYKIERIV
jgi:transcription elongation factor GreA